MVSRLRSTIVLSMSLLCLCTPSVRADVSAASADSTITIPGPLRSFLRMAGFSQQISADDVLPFLAGKISAEGYTTDVGRPPENWLLLQHYVQQARELQDLAGPLETIRVENCKDAAYLLKILGYKLRQGCDPQNIALITDIPMRAFLTLDSGFPLADLEEALQKGVPFVYPFPGTKVAVLFKESDWISLSTIKKADTGDMLSLLLHDPYVARLYAALSKNDTETRLELKRSPGLKKLLPYAVALDFYGAEIKIRTGHVIVPGAVAAEPGWKDLVSESPESSGNFVLRLLAKDDGWLAAYFDTLSRIDVKQQQRLTQMPRLKNLYDAFRTAGATPSATIGVFRKAPALLVLYTRAQWEPNGDLHVPGNLDVWKQVVSDKANSTITRDWRGRASGWNSSDQLLQALTAFSRTDIDMGPLPIYLTLNEIDRGRSPQTPLSPETVRLMARRFAEFNSWYLIFSEFPDLDDASISSFIDVADATNKIQNRTLRANALGALQANIGLWQIFARQGQIPRAMQSASWQRVIAPFKKVSSSTQLFDASRSSLGEVLLVATGKPNHTQDEIIDWLAGPHQETPEGQRIHQEVARKIHSVLDDQRLVSLDTLTGLSDGLTGMAHGTAASDDLLELAGELREFELPQQIFTHRERASWVPAIYASRHAELQVQTDLTKIIKTSGSRAQLEAARGQLAPFLRDTLVGLNYAYYEPPGAQMLHHNSLFIRAHDFSKVGISGANRDWSAPDLFGAGTPAGGGAYLIGSLSDLPYVLAEAEENFIVAENLQALISKELVPELLVDATLPRWWGVSAEELHAVALYQRFGEDLLTASASNPQLRNKVVGILAHRVAPKRLEWAQQPTIRAADMAAVLTHMTPADTFYLAVEFRETFPTEAASWGPSGQQLDELCRQHPEEASPEHLSKDFGVPHPTFSRSNARDLLNVKPAYYSGGAYGRLFGETWESSNLYWARLADEMGYPPVMLNRLVPELTQHMVTKIFASNLDDWPALLRAMQETGDEFRQGKIDVPPSVSTLSQK